MNTALSNRFVNLAIQPAQRCRILTDCSSAAGPGAIAEKESLEAA